MLAAWKVGVASFSGLGVAPKPPLLWRLSIHIVAKPKALAGAMSWYWLWAVWRMSFSCTPAGAS